MSDNTVCPYFHSTSGCDVGNEYISPHDVETIVGFCNSRYSECSTYKMIEEHGMNIETIQQASYPQKAIEHDISIAPLSRSFIAVIGVAIALSLIGNIRQMPVLAALPMMIGGLVLMVQGVHDWRKDKAFAATVNCAYGLFSVSLIPLLVLPRAGMSSTPDPWGTTSYLALWGLFSIAIFLTACEADRWLAATFGLLMAAILTLAVATAVTGTGLTHAAALLFVMSGLTSLLSQVFQRTLSPQVVAQGRTENI